MVLFECKTGLLHIFNSEWQDGVFTHSYPWDHAQVLGAHFDRVGSKPFAVYTIRVKDTENRTWRIQRRYSRASAKF